jgi:hypothetical protein
MTAGGWLDAGWQERGLQALRDTLDVDPRTRKAMVQFLFDEGFWDGERLSWDAAIARWNDCLNPTKPSFFKLGELWALMARFDRHHLFLAMADDLGYDVRRKATEERQQELLERLTLLLERVDREASDVRSRLGRLGPAPEERAARAVAQVARFQRRGGDDDMPPGGF